MAKLNQRYSRYLVSATPKPEPVTNAYIEELASQSRKFGFSWFVPELLRHEKLWQEVLLASFSVQLLALAMPLFTQVVIDRVALHSTQSTLLVIAPGMAVFMVFSIRLSWLRKYPVLHIGNRVDTVLVVSVFECLFKLPSMYFQHRPTYVISALLRGVETIREFIASAAVTLILGLPFLLIFVDIMFYYSVTLTLIALAILFAIVLSSLIVAPMFQTKLQEQLMLGARNQAFITEYVVGLETVTSLQLEPQLALIQALNRKPVRIVETRSSTSVADLVESIQKFVEH